MKKRKFEHRICTVLKENLNKNVPNDTSTR